MIELVRLAGRQTSRWIGREALESSRYTEKTQSGEKHTHLNSQNN